MAAEKVGAGLLFWCQGEVLLLLRNSSHNDNTWGLPGGNLEGGENLAEAAMREAVEEMGHLPAGCLVHDPANQGQQQLLIKRGKRGQKHYTVFVAEVSEAAKAGFQPRLNHEHKDWRWFKLDELKAGVGAVNALAAGVVDLHPVVGIMLHGHWEHLQRILPNTAPQT